MVFLLTNILNLNETFVDVSIVFTVLVIAYIASGYLLDIKDYVLYRKRNKEEEAKQKAQEEARQEAEEQARRQHEAEEQTRKQQQEEDKDKKKIKYSFKQNP
jgi:flagellar biosynthesis/type III secretory pathway M-ring protein FliF/YscJ